jgi:S-adenosylmethionine-diacylglycerol 3-amino-3-carboxypropyl transferase
LPAITWNTSTLTETLRDSKAEYDFIGLSNILDWLSPDEAQETLTRAHVALRRGGCVLIRQLNSTLDIPSFGPNFHWETEVSSKLHACDRSYFYRRLHLGRKR